MNVLAINSGSATLKFKAYAMPEENLLIEGYFKNYSKGKYTFDYKLKDQEALKLIINNKGWNNRVANIFKLLATNKIEIHSVAHRVVHGGEVYTGPVLLNVKTLKEIEKFSDIAPLHNPYELNIVREVFAIKPELTQYACFDTAFFLTLPPKAYLYALPYKYYEKLKIRRYGFHGLSHGYISKEITKILANLNLKNNKIITCHLGSGSSVAAILDGKSVDTSMGFSPTENLIMATRVGEIDFDAIQYLQTKLGLTDKKIDQITNYRSGLLGISQYTQDMKQLLVDYGVNNFAKLAIDMYVYSIVKYIGSFYTILGGADGLVFTGGVGQGSDIIREKITDSVKALGIKIDKSKNSGKIDVVENLNISDASASTQVWVIPTNEELEMAREIQVVSKLS